MTALLLVCESKCNSLAVSICVSLMCCLFQSIKFWFYNVPFSNVLVVSIYQILALQCILLDTYCPFWPCFSFNDFPWIPLQLSLLALDTVTEVLWTWDLKSACSTPEEYVQKDNLMALGLYSLGATGILLYMFIRSL